MSEAEALKQLRYHLRQARHAAAQLRQADPWMQQLTTLLSNLEARIDRRCDLTSTVIRTRTARHRRAPYESTRVDPAKILVKKP